jgi:hypothetical protein
LGDHQAVVRKHAEETDRLKAMLAEEKEAKEAEEAKEAIKGTAAVDGSTLAAARVRRASKDVGLAAADKEMKAKEAVGTERRRSARLEARGSSPATPSTPVTPTNATPLPPPNSRNTSTGSSGSSPSQRWQARRASLAATRSQEEDQRLKILMGLMASPPPSTKTSPKS